MDNSNRNNSIEHEKSGVDQSQTPLFDAVKAYGEKKPTYLKIPGHRYEKGINPLWREAVGDEIFKFDLTETPMTDDLHNASGAIKEAEELASALWGSEYSHFLVNGSTCGNEAMVMTTANNNQLVCLPRNAHKSALMGLKLGGGKPVYIMPQIEEEWGLHGGITPEQVADMFAKNPDCRGVMVVSPSYYGICSDLEGIAKVCHEHNAVLMVDEAHGAHCYFSDKLPKGAIQSGADMCVQSIHKVTGSFTQSSVIHVKSKLVDRSFLESNLQMVQSTSPSYLLMTSLDLARQDMAVRGPEMIDRALELARAARAEINKIPGIKCAGKELIGRAGIYDFDETRLTVSAAEIGLTGFELCDILFEEYNVDLELADYRNALAIVTFANEKEDLDKLVAALKDISGRFSKSAPIAPAMPLPQIPEYVLSPREAYFSKKKRISWEDAVGKISGELIAPYPPGIPLIYEGERMSSEVWNYLSACKKRKDHLHGPSDSDLNTLLVIED